VEFYEFASSIHYIQNNSFYYLFNCYFYCYSAGPSTYPLQGNINQYAEFFVNVSIGTPPQILRVQVDTGSTDLVVFASDCYKCPSAPNVTYFYPSKSKTNSPIECDDDEYDCDVNNCWNDDYCPLEIEYGGGGSINGYAATDTITLGPISAKASFGLIEQISGAFENLGIDGCWGFAYEALSSWGDGAVVDHMMYDNKLYASFSLCLTPSNPVMDIGTNYQGNSEYQWTKLTSQDWFSIEMEDFAVDGKSLGISKLSLNSNGVIVDSGTTLFLVSKKVMEAIQARMVAMCSSSVNLPGVCNSTATETLFNGYCFPMTDSDIALFPNVSTTLKDMSAPLVIPPQAYLWEGAGIEGVYCLGIQYVDSADGLPIILGDVVMQNWHVVFDKQKNMVGWGPLSSCPSA
jgi:hypothetical protein